MCSTGHSQHTDRCYTVDTCERVRSPVVHTWRPILNGRLLARCSAHGPPNEDPPRPPDYNHHTTNDTITSSTNDNGQPKRNTSSDWIDWKPTDWAACSNIEHQHHAHPTPTPVSPPPPPAPTLATATHLLRPCPAGHPPSLPAANQTRHLGEAQPSTMHGPPCRQNPLCQLPTSASLSHQILLPMLYPHRFSLAMACAAGKAPSPWYHGVLHPTFTVVMYTSPTRTMNTKKKPSSDTKSSESYATQCAMHCTALT